MPRGPGRPTAKALPPRPALRRAGGRGAAAAYTSQDIRFTTKGETLYAFVGAWPESRIGAGSRVWEPHRRNWLAQGSKTFPFSVLAAS